MLEGSFAVMCRLLACLCEEIIEPTLSFVSKDVPLSPTEPSAVGVHQVMCFTKFLSTLFDGHLLEKRQREQVLQLSDDSLAAVIAGLFAVAYVWAFGSNLQQRSLSSRQLH